MTMVALMPAQLRVPRHRLGVVPGRHGDHAGSTLRGTQQRDAVGGTAFLERARGLQMVVFQIDFRAGEPREPVRPQKRRAEHRPLNPLGGGLHIREADHLSLSRR
jgi:hypothetical protein